MDRTLKIALFSAGFALIAAAPEAFAQRGRGGKRGGGGKRAGSGLFKKGGKKRAAVDPGPGLVRPTTPLPTPTQPNAPKVGSPLAAEEKRFQALIDEIDDAIAKADEQRKRAQEHVDTLGFRMPEGIERGSAAWRDLQRPIFETCDYDVSGWLSFRELRAALDFDAEEYARYDRDRDGRVGPREFMARYDEVVAKTGAFRLPKPSGATVRAEPRSSDQLRAAFDRDGDGGLDAVEISTLLVDYGRTAADAAAILTSVDSDQNAKAEGAELYQLSRAIAFAFLAAPDADGKKSKPQSVVQLFGKTEVRPGGRAAASEPPWIPGPVPHFRRLDLDLDGFVTVDEMIDLQGGTGLGTRIGAVLASLDLDEDGRLSEREFLTAVSSARK